MYRVLVAAGAGFKAKFFFLFVNTIALFYFRLSRLRRLLLRLICGKGI
jgi:hypothetical protein